MKRGLQIFRRWFGSTAGEDAAAASNGRLVIVDTETSGLDPKQDRLLAIGGIAVDDDGIRLDDSFEMVLQGLTRGDAENIVVHGLGHETQAAGTPAPAALAAFREWAADAPRAGFHADFDRAVMNNAHQRAGMSISEAPWLDIAPLAAALAPEVSAQAAKSLDDWLLVFGIECMSRHNAAADALATAELLLRLRALAARQGQVGFDALVRIARARKWLGNSDSRSG